MRRVFLHRQTNLRQGRLVDPRLLFLLPPHIILARAAPDKTGHTPIGFSLDQKLTHSNDQQQRPTTHKTAWRGLLKTVHLRHRASYKTPTRTVNNDPPSAHGLGIRNSAGAPQLTIFGSAWPARLSAVHNTTRHTHHMARSRRGGALSRENPETECALTGSRACMLRPVGSTPAPSRRRSPGGIVDARRKGGGSGAGSTRVP